MSRPAASNALDDQCLAVLKSLCGPLSYSLHLGPSGLTVNRHQLTDGGGRIVLTMHFGQARDFELWWSSDPLRFEDPHLYQRLHCVGHGALPDNP